MADSVYEPRCKEIQHHDGVRFAAIINHDGEKIAGGFTEGVIHMKEMRLNYMTFTNLH